MSDEELIAAVTKASATEKERILVQGKSKKSVRVYEVGSTSGKSGQPSENDKVDKLLSAVDALTKQVDSLKFELHEMKDKKNDKYNRGSKYLCDDCNKRNKTFCNHCYKCGSSSHMARGCRNQSSNQGN